MERDEIIHAYQADTLEALQRAIRDLTSDTDTAHPADVYLRNTVTLLLIEKTLTDGSTVRDIIVNVERHD